MTQVAAVSILALTIGLSLGRPRLGGLNIDHAAAAVLGTLLCIAFGLIELVNIRSYLEIIAPAVVTIICLMAITVIAEQSGLFDALAQRIAIVAKGDPKRLFLYIFALGSATGTVFTNDAAVLIFTPLVFQLVQEIEGDDWTRSNKLPFYFAVLYVANVAGALVISNPINLIVAQILNISFVDYAKWMMLPALTSIVASYAGIRLFFRKSLPDRYNVPSPKHISPQRRTAMSTCAIVLGITLLALFSNEVTRVPIWGVTVCAATALLMLHKRINPQSDYRAVFRGIGWDVIIFVLGMFLIIRGVQAQFWTEGFAVALADILRHQHDRMIYVMSFAAAFCSALFNNHPVADVIGLTLYDLDLPQFQKKILALAALIGGDLGPKMLPIGSLAALMWFRMLRQRGVEVSYWLYIRIGVPVTLFAIVLSLFVLHLQILIAQHQDW